MECHETVWIEYENNARESNFQILHFHFMWLRLRLRSAVDGRIRESYLCRWNNPVLYDSGSGPNNCSAGKHRLVSKMLQFKGDERLRIRIARAKTTCSPLHRTKWKSYLWLECGNVPHIGNGRLYNVPALEAVENNSTRTLCVIKYYLHGSM